jgi:hypothetical protein
MKSDKGFVVLISVILISAILLLSILSTSNDAIATRFNLLNSEDKIESFGLARSCLEIVLVRLAENFDFRPGAFGDSIQIEEDSCEITSITKDNSDELIVKTKGMKNQAATNLESKIHFTNAGIIIDSTREI